MTQQLKDNYEIRDLGNLELLARQIVEGFIIGLHKSPFHGFSVEFAEHRLYNQGESTRNIDWKVYARTDKLFTKKFEEETNLRCQVVIDASSTMYFPYDPNKSTELKYHNKLYFSAISAASMMFLCKKQRDAFGLTVFDNEIRFNSNCKSSTTHYYLMLSNLQKLIENPELNKSTNTAEALHQIAENVHRRSLVMIFSDMFENSDKSDELFAALQHLKYNKHEVVLFHVVDKSKEIDFEYDNRPYIFVDMETGEKVKLHPNQVKSEYQKQVAAFKSELQLKCLQYKIDFVEVDINDGYKNILQTYLVKRERMRV